MTERHEAARLIWFANCIWTQKPELELGSPDISEGRGAASDTDRSCCALYGPQQKLLRHQEQLKAAEINYTNLTSLEFQLQKPLPVLRC